MEIPAKITKRQTKRRGVAFDLTFCWQGTRYRPVLGYNLSDSEAKRLAIKRIQEIQADHCDTQRNPPAPFTLQDALELFWASFKAKARIDQTRPRRIIDQYLIPHFGHRPLNSIRAEDGLNYIVTRQEQNASAGTIRREMQIMNRILNLAVNYDKLDKNRLKVCDLPEPNKRMRVVTNEELVRLAKNSSDELWRATVVALCTGLRESKLLALDRNWIRREKDGYWAFLPPAKTRIKGNPVKVPLNRLVLAATARDVESLDGVAAFSLNGRIRAHFGRHGAEPVSGLRFRICISMI